MNRMIHSLKKNILIKPLLKSLSLGFFCITSFYSLANDNNAITTFNDSISHDFFKPMSNRFNPVSIEDKRLISNAKAINLSEKTLNKKGEIQLKITTEDQEFILNLQKNTKLLWQLNPNKLGNTELFRGNIAGIRGSWARITRSNGRITGAVYDGNELWMIDKLEAVKNDLPGWRKTEIQSQVNSSNSNSVIFRAADIHETGTCAENFNGQNLYQNLITELTSAVALPSLAADEQVNLVIVADTEYVASSNGDTNGQVLSQMNVVDGIFSEQVGVQFGIQDIISLSNNGSLTSTNPSTLLNSFRSYVNNTIGNPGLAHLFSGKNLNGSVIGIAYVSAICGSSGVGVTQAGNRGVTGALTAAHEFGHNFGAPHDNQGGSACANTPGNFLMNPSINGSDQFSQCSLTQIASVLSRVNCLVPVDGNPTPTPSPVPSPSPSPSPIPNPDCLPGAIDLRNVEAYSATNTGTFEVSANGCSMTLNGNIWRITETGFDINSDTEINFAFTATGNAEIQGVGFDENNQASDDRVFRLAGNQNWGLTGFNYTGNGNPQQMTIPIGQFYTGIDMGFVVANDNDSGSGNNSVTISNVIISSSSPNACIPLDNVIPFSRTNSGDFDVSTDRCEMTLNGNIWRATNESFQITPSTVLTFDFFANNTGEIHGIGFDENSTASQNRIFQLSGSQNWGIRDFNYNGGVQSFEIPIGQYYTGSAMRLILVNDKDNGSPNNQTIISNVRLRQ